jgi:hypothetical protein
VAPTPLNSSLVRLDRDDGQPVAREHLRDAGTHGAEPDDADLLELPCHEAVLLPNAGNLRKVPIAEP